MKDLSHIERKFEEYERRIHQLKRVERELNSLNDEGFESEANAIKSKLKDPKKVEEVERAFSELKQKIKEKELKRKEADKKYREAKDLIKSAESVIENARNFGCNVFEVEELIESAERAIYIGDYEKAIRNVKDAKEVTEEIKRKSKPEISVELSKEKFQQGVWEDVSLKISNDGNAHAKDIEIGFSDEVKVKGLEIIEKLDVGEETELEVSFKPVDVGERVPLEIGIRFKDLNGKRYEEEETVNIKVGEIKREEVKIKEKEYEIPIEKKEGALIIERAIYDPCKRDFTEGRLPRMKEWINRYDKGAYWFAISIQNNTDKEINDWGVEIETSAALKIKEAKIEGIEIEIPNEAHLNTFKISVPKEYGIVIPKGGAQRVYFKLRADKPKTTYEISGVFKSKITGDVQIRPKEFKYLCDVNTIKIAIKENVNLANDYVSSQLWDKYPKKEDLVKLTESFRIVLTMDRMCNQDAKTEEYLDKLLVLKNYTEGFSENFTKQVVVFARFMKQEQLGYLDDEYKGKVRRFCTNLFDVFISEFLKG